VAVVDASPLADKAVVIYNTDVAASGTFTDWYLAKRGIPSANKIGFAMGTDPYLWAYDASRFANFYTPLYEKVMTVGARAVITAAGCPNYIACKQVDNTTDGLTPLANTAGLVKRIYATGAQPRVNAGNDDSGDFITLRDGSVTPGVQGTALRQEITVRAAGYLQTVQSAAYNSAYTAGGLTWEDGKNLYEPTSALRRDYSKLTDLPCGVAGWMIQYGATGSSHPGTLLTDSQAVVNRLQGQTQTLAQAQGRRVLVCIGNTTANSSLGPAARSAILVKELQDAGFTDVQYFYATSVGDTAAEQLAPSASASFTLAQIDAGSVTRSNVWLVVGYGWPNDRWNPASSPTWRPASVPYITPASDGLIIAGLSDHQHWSRYWMADGGAGGFGRLSHPNVFTGTYHWERVRSMLRGETLCEMDYWQKSAFDFVAIGDPLHNPIRV
jgi:hypothetical protein